MSKWQNFNLNLSLERGQSCRKPKSGEASEDCVALASLLCSFTPKVLPQMPQNVTKEFHINRATPGDEFTMHKLVKAERNDLA